MRKHLFSLVALATTLLCVQSSKAQNSSPYWSLAGNSNATTASKLGTTNGIPLRLFTNNAVRVYIHPTTGNVGIGSTAPAQKLHVAGNAYFTGNVGIGNSAPSYKLHVTGNASISNGLIVGQGGIYGYGGATNSFGVYGSGSSYGVFASSPGTGVYGNSSNYSYGVWGNSGSYGVYGTGGTYAVWGKSSGGWGVYGQSSSSIGVGGTSGSSFGVYGNSSSYPGVYGNSSSHNGIEGHSTYSYGAAAWGVHGVYGQATTGFGGNFRSNSGYGGYFYSASSYGLRAATGLSTKNWAGVFDGNIYVFGAYQGSDRNLKKNIEDFSDAMSIINQLKPRSYEFRNEGKLASMNLPRGKHYGLIAQEIEEILPNLVMEVDSYISDNTDPQLGPKPAQAPGESTQTGTQLVTPGQNTSVEKMIVKSVNYTELIPILVKGIQELSQENKTLRRELSELKLLMLKVTGQTTSTGVGTLMQSIPNPAKTSTSITYSLPEGTNGAQLLVTDALGRTIKQMTLSTSGVINLDVSALASGVYNYSIIVNGKIIDTKKMTVAR